MPPLLTADNIQASIAKSLIERFVVRANDAIYFKLVRGEKDLDANSKSDTFHPEFTHQIFGEQESILGYRDLRINIYYTSSTLKRLVTVSYSEKIDAATSDGIEPDPILPVLSEKVPGEITSNLDEFSRILSSESTFHPIGEKTNQTIITSPNGGPERTFEVYKCDINEKGFLEYHSRIETWLLWFIDGASYIDTDDDRWDFHVVYEKTTSLGANGHSNGSSGDHVRYHFVGYCTVYRYFAYPDQIRPRISQFLILPPFQRQGLGVFLLQSIYNYYLQQPNILDMTVEDPADNFVRLRDYVDCLNCSKLPSFSVDSLQQGWSDRMAKEAQEKLRLNKKQARRVYEILKLKSLDRSNAEVYKNYRLEVKKRLNAPFVKLNRKATTDQPTPSADLRLEELKNLYNEVEGEYLETIEKLAKA